MFSKYFFKNIQLTSFTIRNNYRMSEEVLQRSLSPSLLTFRGGTTSEITKSKSLNLQMRKVRLTWANQPAFINSQWPQNRK